MTPSELNEDGVPINEADATRYWRNYAKECGIYTARIENIGTSLPDVFMIYRGLVIFQEIKVRRGNLIYAPSFQWAGMNALAKDLHSWQLIYVVYNQDSFELYEYKTIRDCPEEIVKGTGYDKVKIDLSKVMPFAILSSTDGFEAYLKLLYAKAFKSKSSHA